MSVTSHRGSCHCGAVRYTAELDTTQPALVCNCSICGRSGSMLAFVPEDKFTLEQGKDHLTEYTFNKHVIKHQFCKTCGVKPFANAVGPKGPTVAINMRTLEDVDVFTQPTTQFNGRDR